mmetsp:Transcript_86971/g.145120  ORF Transcript_86971/g.145120 Transcript_86971/m.145120 type:complete len:261 (-) Transcript_86971:1465-2247(-)
MCVTKLGVGPTEGEILAKGFLGLLQIPCKPCQSPLGHQLSQKSNTDYTSTTNSSSPPMRFSFIPCTAPCAAVGLLSDTRPIQHRTLNPQRWSCEIVALCMLCGNMGLALHQGGHGSARNHNNTTPHSRHGDNGGGWQQTRSACARTHTHTHTHTCKCTYNPYGPAVHVVCVESLPTMWFSRDTYAFHAFPGRPCVPLARVETSWARLTLPPSSDGLVDGLTGVMGSEMHQETAGLALEGDAARQLQSGRAGEHQRTGQEP